MQRAEGGRRRLGEESGAHGDIVGGAGRMRGTRGGVPPAPDVRHRDGGGGVAHSTGSGQRRIGGIMRKRPGVQRWRNPPMCRATRSAHGSPSAKNRHSSRSRGIMRKTRSRPAGATLSNVQHHRTGREELLGGDPAPSDEASTPAIGPRGPRPARQRPSAGPRREPGPARSRPDTAGDRPRRTGPGGARPSPAPPGPRSPPPHRPRPLPPLLARKARLPQVVPGTFSSGPLRSAPLPRIPIAPNNVIPAVSEGSSVGGEVARRPAAGCIESNVISAGLA